MGFPVQPLKLMWNLQGPRPPVGRMAASLLPEAQLSEELLSFEEETLLLLSYALGLPPFGPGGTSRAEGTLPALGHWRPLCGVSRVMLLSLQISISI